MENFYDQAIESGTKRYGEIRKLRTGQGEDCTTTCLLDYDAGLFLGAKRKISA